MKVIDIMKKIANGEIFKFRVDDIDYYVDKENYICEEEDGTRVDWYIDEEWLNTKAEIIEDKNIRKLPNEVHKPNNFEEVVYIAEDLAIKINEIIDYINKEETK